MSAPANPPIRRVQLWECPVCTSLSFNEARRCCHDEWGEWFALTHVSAVVLPEAGEAVEKFGDLTWPDTDVHLSHSFHGGFIRVGDGPALDFAAAIQTAADLLDAITRRAATTTQGDEKP
jgi:hypothetical protein